MTMLTRCTACNTAFRITTEQLVTRQGKVRCGECGEVFSALDQLERTGDRAAAAPSPQDGETAIPSQSTVMSAPNLTTAEVVLHGPPGAESIAAAASDALPVPQAPSPDPTAAEAGIPPDAGKRRWGSVLGILVGLAALGFQATYFYREEIAVRLPETKPWLERMCAQVSCRFDAPRDPQAISIESHDLQADPASKNLLSLIALLRNRAGFVQDSPYLELTLTDAQDAPITRRVFTPRDYAAATQIGPGAELQVRVLIDASQVKASGYRLYAFYP
jgi:predicted Zn finger-like uncharacterized protein